MKLLILLQFYEGDKTAAMDLARLIADIQPVHSDSADIAFCARFDTKHDMDTVSYVSRKFNVFTHTSTRRGKGWPTGPNLLFFDSMRWAIDQCKVKNLPTYKAILTAESDDCPLAWNWISTLLKESERADVVGSLQWTPKIHVNGNCLFNGSPEFLSWLSPRLSCRPNEGWDTACWPKWKDRAADTKAIRSVWGMPDISETTWDRFANDGCVFLHGVKDDSARRLARKKLL